MLNNSALLLFRSLDEDCLHFIAGTSKRNSLTASTFEKKKSSGDMTNTFNIQYVN